VNVTSNEPSSPGDVTSTWFGETVALPIMAENGMCTSPLSCWKLTSCSTRACRPSAAGALTNSWLVPVAVLNSQTPAPVIVFWLAPTARQTEDICHTFTAPSR
jgi:hypothetical protein